MEVKKGYKQTEAGIIPRDWEVNILTDISTEIGDGIHATPRYVDSSDCFFVNGNNLVDGKILVTDDTKCVSRQEYNLLKKKLGNRTVLMSINGTIGNLAYFSNENIVLGKSAAYINLKDEFDKRLIYYLLQHTSIKDYYENELTGTTIRNLSLDSIRKTPLPLPATKAEQAAIAEALSDADALISRLEQLIAKKRNIKQGAMQELLTGKKRLPGFSGEWEVKCFGEVGKCIRGVSYNGEEDLFPYDTNVTVRLLRSNNVQNGIIDLNELQFVTNEKVKPTQHLQENDIVICMANGSKQLVGKSAIFRLSDYEYTFGAFMGCFRTDPNQVHSGFISNAFQTYQYRSFIDVLLSGSSINNLKPSDIESIEIPFPTKAEQAAIAQILSDMDGEIEQLEQKLDKYRMIKQGMMQELLTGKTRLV